jgi:hypothetical protein
MIPFYHEIWDKSSGQFAQSFAAKNVQNVQKLQMLLAGTRWRADKKGCPHLVDTLILYGANFARVDIVAATHFVNSLCGLVVQLGVFTNKCTDMLACGCGIQATDIEPTIGFNIGNLGSIGNQNNCAIIVLADSGLCVGHSG